MSYMHDINKTDMRVALLGITGTGKSTLGNNILKKNIFKTSGLGKSETENCTAAETHHDSRKIMVVDTPGFFDTEMTFAQFQERLIPFIDKSSPGPHVILFLVRAERYTEENTRAVYQFCETFGDDILRHTVVVFTHLNSDTSEEDYMRNLQTNLKFFLDKCKKRFLFMPNPKNTTETSAKVQELLNVADKLIADNYGACYTDEMYKAQEKLIKEKLEEQARIQREEEEEKLSALKAQIAAQYDTQIDALRNDVNLSNAERERKQEELNKLLERMKESDDAIRNLQHTITLSNQRIADLSRKSRKRGLCSIQ